MDSVIYYFSGTGNSYKIAKNISEKLGDTKLIRISSENMHLASKNNYRKIGIIFPVYYFSLPKMVAKFLESLSVHKNAYVYSIGTCGGFVGVSFLHLKDILKSKGCLNLSTFKILMPDNYQVLYAPSPLERQLDLIAKSDVLLDKIVGIINDEIVHIEKEPNIFLKSIGELGSKSFKPQLKDKNFWVAEKCDGCKICSKVCPANDIVMENGRPNWLGSCQQCLACMQWCPQQAIQYKKSTVKRDRYTHPEVKLVELINSKE